MPNHMDVDERPDGASTIPHWVSPDGEVLTLVEGNGARVTDDTGTEYLEFGSQLYCVNAGYDAEPIIDAMQEQLHRIPYVSSGKNNDTREKLARAIIERSPDHLEDVFFSVSGSEANESAAQFARNYTGASKVLTRWRSYHGSTYGAGSLTGDPETREAFEPHASTTGSVKFLPPLSHRSPFDADSPEELAEKAIEHVEFVIRNEGPDTIAAILMEPVAGSSGAFPAPPTYFEQLREVADEYDILLIADEVITGFGRVGDWFGIQSEGITPDMITFAKGVTSAYAPLSGVIVTRDIADHVRGGFNAGQTFAGHPVSAAAGLGAIEFYEDEELFENVRTLESYLHDRLTEIEDEHDVVGDIRGRGFLWAVEFTDPKTGEPFFDPRVKSQGDNPVTDVIDEAQDRGVLFNSGRPSFQIMISPPLVVDEDDLDEALTVLDESIAAVFD